MKVYNNYAFIVADSDDHGMQVFDMTRLRTLSGPPVRLTADALYTGTGNTHNMVGSSEGFVYLCGSTNTSYPNNCNGRLCNFGFLSYSDITDARTFYYGIHFIVYINQFTELFGVFVMLV